MIELQPPAGEDAQKGEVLLNISDVNNRWNTSALGGAANLGDFPLQVFNRQRSDEMSDERYVIVRTYTAGVFAGVLESRNGKEVVVRGARRLWYWSGAASLSQLAVTGTKKPKDCKFPVAVDRVELTEAIEILDVTPEARASIEAVPVWTA